MISNGMHMQITWACLTIIMAFFMTNAAKKNTNPLKSLRWWPLIFPGQNWSKLKKLKTVTDSEFCDQLVLQIIEKYGSLCSIPTVALYHTSHGSKAFPYAQHGWFVLCQVKTFRRCLDCPFTPCL